ncbi:MAG TPA: lipoyl(octanoyl) transferase, partial [Saprospiraceae bacterium]|nr:lipoyl(octanoyl) transferase [Saprospiraceae bacterium]
MEIDLAPKVYFEEIQGMKYQEVWDYQAEYQQLLVKNKRLWQALPPKERPKQTHKLIFCEHSHVYTLGKS